MLNNIKSHLKASVIIDEIKNQSDGATRAIIAMLAIIFFMDMGFGLWDRAQERKINKSVYSDYVEYFSVEPSKSEFCVGENLSFVTDSEIKQPTRITWTDVVFCDFPDDDIDGYGFYLSHPSEYKYSKPRERQKNPPWNYPLSVDKPGQCFLDSTSAVYLDDGSRRFNDIHSGIFSINQCDE